MPPNQHPKHAGRKGLFTKHVSDSLLDLRALRNEIEKAEQLAETVGAPHKARQSWRNYRDLIEHALDVRIDLLDADVASHEHAIDGAGCPLLCRAGVQTDPERGALMAAARQRKTAGAVTPTAAA